VLGAIARAMAGLTGWRRYGTAFLLGAIATLAMPPWYLLPLMVVGLVGLVWLLDGANSGRRALFVAWVWGFGHFVVGCYWIMEAYFVPPADFVAFGPPMVLGLAALLAVFVSLAAYVARLVVHRWPSRFQGWRRVVPLAVAISVGEWMRSWVMTGFPWSPLGQVWAFSDAMLQSASLWGVHGLGLLTLLICMLPAALGDRQADGARRIAWLGGALAPVLLVVLLFAGGLWRLAQPVPGGEGPLVRLVQPNTPQGEKWRPELRDRHLAELIALTRQPGARPPQHVIWPETAVPFLLNTSADYLRLVGATAPQGGFLITGAPRAESGGAPVTAPRRVWNSLHVIDGQGAIRATYDKAHLVPFGEYLPLRNVLPILGDTIGRGSFEAGPGPATVEATPLPAFGGIICYEVIFSGAVVDRAHRPRWMLNLTNDSWFGTSSGPFQHLVSARLRVVEEGLPMIRVANTGVSAVIDARGRVLASLGMEQKGIIDHAIPPALPPTPYVRFGLAGWLGLMVLSIAFAGLVAHREQSLPPGRGVS
jgi:apolipoprotein N-acyltransferase